MHPEDSVLQCTGYLQFQLHCAVDVVDVLGIVGWVWRTLVAANKVCVGFFVYRVVTC